MNGQSHRFSSKRIIYIKQVDALLSNNQVLQIISTMFNCLMIQYILNIVNILDSQDYIGRVHLKINCNCLNKNRTQTEIYFIAPAYSYTK